MYRFADIKILRVITWAWWLWTMRLSGSQHRVRLLLRQGLTIPRF